MCARHAGGICEGSCRLIKIGRVLVLEGTCVNPHCEFIQFIRASLLLTIGSSPRTGQPDRAPRNSSKMATRNKKCSRILEFAMHTDGSSPTTPRAEKNFWSLIDGKQYVSFMGGTGQVIGGRGATPPAGGPSTTTASPKLFTFALDGNGLQTQRRPSAPASDSENPNR